MAQFLNQQGLKTYSNLIKGELDALDARIEVLETGGKYMPVTGGTFTGDIGVQTLAGKTTLTGNSLSFSKAGKITGLNNPTQDNEAANKAYVDSKAGGRIYIGSDSNATDILDIPAELTALFVTVTWQSTSISQSSRPCVAVKYSNQTVATVRVSASNGSYWAILDIIIISGTAQIAWVGNTDISHVDVIELVTVSI